MNEAYALLAMIQDRIGGVLRDRPDDLLPRITARRPLLAQLQDAGVDIPDGLVVAVDGLLDLDDLIGNAATGKLLDRLRARASTLAQGFLDSNGPGVIRASVTRILEDNQGGTCAASSTACSRRSRPPALVVPRETRGTPRFSGRASPLNGPYFTVTLLARFRGLSGSWPRRMARS